MPTDTAIDREFPGAIDQRRFVDLTARRLAPHGFAADTAIACVSACRDEIAHPLYDDVARVWGEAFHLGSLGGMLTLGRTGFGAARGHSPVVDGRERFVFLAMPHIGVDRDGAIGRVQRRGQPAATPACGALVALADELARGPLSDAIDPDDLEQSWLRRRLARLVDGPCDIAELTRCARRAIQDDLERLLADADMSGADYAVFTGVQIHTPDGDRVWPADAYAVVDGQRRAIALP